MYIKSGDPYFNIFQQQDSAEVLSFILCSLFNISKDLRTFFNFTCTTTVSCLTCSSSHDNVSEETVLHLPLLASVQSSVHHFLKPENMAVSNSVFCNECKSKQPTQIIQHFSSSGQYLIIHLLRFAFDGKSTRKDLSEVKPSQHLCLPIEVEQITFKKHYHLVSVINHAGKLNSGHYTTEYKNSTGQGWTHCNDSALSRKSCCKINPSLVYLLLYKAT